MLFLSFFLSFVFPFFFKIVFQEFLAANKQKNMQKRLCQQSKDNGFPSYVRCGAGLALAGLLRWMDLYLDRQQRHRVYGRQRMVRSLEGSLIPPLAQHSNEMQLDQ